MARLNRTIVNAIAAPESGELVVMDADLPGFGVRVMASGAKSFFVRYRVGGGRGAQMRRLTIGRTETLTPEKARDAARSILARVRLGEDPAGDKADRRSAHTVSELIDEWLDGPGKRDRRGKVRSASNIACDKGRLNHHVKALIGRNKLPEVNRSVVESLRDSISQGRTAKTEATKKRGVARVTGGEGAATRTLRTLSTVFSYAVQRGYVTTNPVMGVRKAPDRHSERFLSEDELKALGKALDAADASVPKAAAIIRLLAMTGCRRREIEALTWVEVDLLNGFLRLKESKTGSKNVFISQDAATILSKIPRVEGKPWVFPGTTGKGHYQHTAKVWTDVREKAGLADVRLHDLRHTFASRSLAEGASLEVVAALLGHRERRTTERYAHLASHPIKEAANRAGRSISDSMAQ